MTDCWYLLRTKTNAEQQAQDHLTRQGYDSYFPRFAQRVRRFGRRFHVVGPLFPSYLFLRLAVGLQPLSPVKSTRGVLGIVRFGEDYAVVPPHIIAQLRRRADRYGLHASAERIPKPTDRIRVKEGPFEGVDAIFVRDCGEERVLVLLNILGQERTLQLPESCIELQA
jgi:transcriptional antiterminator RfaH